MEQWVQCNKEIFTMTRKRNFLIQNFWTRIEDVFIIIISFGLMIRCSRDSEGFSFWLCSSVCFFCDFWSFFWISLACAFQKEMKHERGRFLHFNSRVLSPFHHHWYLFGSLRNDNNAIIECEFNLNFLKELSFTSNNGTKQKKKKLTN